MRACRAHLLLLIVISIGGLATPARVSAALEARIPLHDGRLATADLARGILKDLHLPSWSINAGQIDLRGLRGAIFIRALDAALGQGCDIQIENDALVFHIDPSRLPHSIRSAKHDLEVFTATCAPEATASQRRGYGLLMPQIVNPNLPMVVLIHGLDCDHTTWFPMAKLLEQSGYQVAYFDYPSDGALDRSADMLARNMIALREQFPAMPLDVIGHSMGALLARDYVEGPSYAGGVRHLILLGPPNLGSKWAMFRFALELQEHYKLWRHDKDWHWTWMITDGLGEAGTDLEPHSDFLHELNSRSRRAGVMYTIVAGAQSPVYSIGASVLRHCAGIFPSRTGGWWGIRQTEHALIGEAVRLKSHIGQSDGPVTLKSTRLPGVSDYVALPCDHVALYCPDSAGQIAAWDVIRNRLSQ